MPYLARNLILMVLIFYITILQKKILKSLQAAKTAVMHRPYMQALAGRDENLEGSNVLLHKYRVIYIFCIEHPLKTD